MTTVIIPKELARKGDLVLVPRKEYEDFEAWASTVKTFTPTRAQLRRIRTARRNLAHGKFLTLDEFKGRMGIES